MSNLIPYGGEDKLPALRPSPPPVSDGLAAWCAPIEDGHQMPHYPSWLQEQARTALEAIEPMMVPVSERRLREWLLPIPSSVRNGGRNPDETKRWLGAVALAMADVPGCLFNRESQVAALRTFEFFPSAADIYQVIADDRARLTRRVLALRHIAEMPPSDETQHNAA